jgi:hypothetical protein
MNKALLGHQILRLESDSALMSVAGGEKCLWPTHQYPEKIFGAGETNLMPDPTDVKFVE